MQSAVLQRHFVRLSLRLFIRDVEISWSYKGWNSSKIISRMISLGYLLFADPNTTDLPPKFWWEYGWSMEKCLFVYKIVISLKWGKIGPRLLVRTDWCQSRRPWMTLKGHHAHCFKTHAPWLGHRLRGPCVHESCPKLEVHYVAHPKSLGRLLVTRQ